MYYIAAEQISGKALCQLDRETLKEIGIKSIGKQLELLTNVKSLFGKKVILIKVLYTMYTSGVFMKLPVLISWNFKQHYRALSVEAFKGNTLVPCNDSVMKYNETIICLFVSKSILAKLTSKFFPRKYC